MEQKTPFPDLRATQKRYVEELALTLMPSTVLDAKSSTNGFITYLYSAYPELTSFAALQRRHVEGWLHHLASKRSKRSTRRKLIIVVRKFLQTLQLAQWDEAPLSALFRNGDLPAQDRYLPRPLAPQTDCALSAALRRQGGFLSKALLLLRATGLRLGEILDLDIGALSEISANQWSLRVPLGKLHSERVIPVESQTAKLFAELVELRGTLPPVAGERTGKPTHFLLMRPNGRRYTHQALRYYLAQTGRRAGLSEHLTPHRLRHSCATELLRAGMALPALMKFLGHRSIGMTLRYAEVTGVDVRRAYNESLPVLKERYELGSLRPRGHQVDQTTDTRRSILDRLADVAIALESYRRDRVPEQRVSTRLQRLLDRLRRLTADLDSATS